MTAVCYFWPEMEQIGERIMNHTTKPQRHPFNGCCGSREDDNSCTFVLTLILHKTFSLAMCLMATCKIQKCLLVNSDYTLCMYTYKYVRTCLRTKV